MHRKNFVVIAGFLLIVAPGAASAWLDLIDRIKGNNQQVTFSFGNISDVYSLVFPFLGLLVLLFGLYWTRTPRPTTEAPKPRSSGLNMNPGSNQGQPENSGIRLEAVLERAERAEAHIREIERPASWINTMMADDLENLAKRVVIAEATVKSNHLPDTEPYLTFSLTITNRTIFKVAVADGNINGLVQWGGLPLRQRLRSRAERPLVIQRGDTGFLEIQQDVMPATAERILS